MGTLKINLGKGLTFTGDGKITTNVKSNDLISKSSDGLKVANLNGRGTTSISTQVDNATIVLDPDGLRADLNVVQSIIAFDYRETTERISETKITKGGSRTDLSSILTDINFASEKMGRTAYFPQQGMFLMLKDGFVANNWSEDGNRYPDHPCKVLFMIDEVGSSTASNGIVKFTYIKATCLYSDMPDQFVKGTQYTGNV